MHISSLDILRCPGCQGTLRLKDERQEGGDILQGTLTCSSCDCDYAVVDGIPRFVSNKNYNKSWDFKWLEIDKGRGLAYLSVDKNDPAYDIHGIFDKNSYDGEPYKSWKGKLVLDAGCGIGQNSYELLKMGVKVVAIDLTRGVDVFRKIMLERFPEFKDNLLIVQANIFHLPFKDGAFDGIMSFGVLHHTGDTHAAMKSLASKLKPSGDMNIWVYSSEYTDETEYEWKDKTVNRKIINCLKKNKALYFYRDILFYETLRFFIKRLPDRIKYYILFFPASDLWYKFCKVPYIGILGTAIFHTVPHPNFWYRLINLFDAFSPTYTAHHTEKEVVGWFKELNFEIKDISKWKLGVWGVKMKEDVLADRATQISGRALNV